MPDARPLAGAISAYFVPAAGSFNRRAGFVLEQIRLYAKLRRPNLIGGVARMEPETVQFTPAKHGTDQVAAKAAAELRLTRAQWLVLIAAFLGWLFDGFEISGFFQ